MLVPDPVDQLWTSGIGLAAACFRELRHLVEELFAPARAAQRIGLRMRGGCRLHLGVGLGVRAPPRASVARSSSRRHRVSKSRLRVPDVGGDGGFACRFSHGPCDGPRTSWRTLRWRRTDAAGGRQSAGRRPLVALAFRRSSRCSRSCRYWSEQGGESQLGSISRQTVECRSGRRAASEIRHGSRGGLL